MGKREVEIEIIGKLKCPDCKGEGEPIKDLKGIITNNNIIYRWIQCLKCENVFLAKYSKLK